MFSCYGYDINTAGVKGPYRSQHMTKPTKWPVHTTKTQISPGMCPVWSDSLLCAFWQMPRLIWVFAGRTVHLWFCRAAAHLVWLELRFWCHQHYLGHFEHCQLTYYRNVPKFSDRQVWANSADPDQIAPRGAVWSGSPLFAIPAASFGCITLRKSHLVQLLWGLQ